MYAAHVARTGRLPIMQPPYVVEVPVEGNQPPLYYVLAALMLHMGGMGDLVVDVPPRNPHSTKQGGLEASLYERRSSDYPWPKIDRAMRILRFGFLPLSAIVVACAYAIAALACPADRAVPLLAAGFAGTLPQFSFIMASVTNDTLANAVAALALLVMVSIIARRRARRAEVLALGALLGVAFATKMTLVALVPGALVAVWLAGAGVRPALASSALCIGVACLVMAPLVVESRLFQGDLFGLTLLQQMFPQRVHDPGLDYVTGTMAPALFYSFWGVFGHMNVHLGRIYLLFAALAACAGFGLGLRLWRGGLDAGARRLLVLAGVVLAAVGAGIVRFNLSFAQPQGRYVFPALTILSLLFALGVSRLVGGSRGAGLVTVALLAALNAAILAGVVAPAYGRGVRTAMGTVPSVWQSTIALAELRRMPERATPVQHLPVHR
jgi:MFS family permease